MSKAKGWERDYPYYKVQVFEDRVFAWMDVKQSFATAEKAQAYIKAELKDAKTRIIIVEGERSRHPLDES